MMKLKVGTCDKCRACTWRGTRGVLLRVDSSAAPADRQKDAAPMLAAPIGVDEADDFAAPVELAATPADIAPADTGESIKG